MVKLPLSKIDLKRWVDKSGNEHSDIIFIRVRMSKILQTLPVYT